jgi:hypothetical protein
MTTYTAGKEFMLLFADDGWSSAIDCPLIKRVASLKD